MRVTTYGTLLGYKSSLMRSGNQLNAARDKVLTQRNFNSYAEDPAAASQAFQLRRLHSRTSDQLTNSNSMISKFDSAWTSMGTVKKTLEEAFGEIGLVALNGSTGTGRQPLGEALSAKADSIVQSLNVQYSDSFIFGGYENKTAPFSWNDDKGLCFQGIPVDTGTTPRPEGAVPDPATITDKTSEWGKYFEDPLNSDFKTLASKMHQSLYVDVGAGLSNHEDGNFNTSTAFNGAISGLDILGFGKDADGDPTNAVSLMKKLSGILKNCSAEDGAYNPPSDEAVAVRINDKLKGTMDELTNKWTNLDGQAKYLKANKEQLTDTANTLNEQILSLEQVNMADAITDFSWAQYCYNSALKVGNSILSQSLIDYMN